MILRRTLTVVLMIGAVALSAACSDNGKDTTSTGGPSAPPRSSAETPDEFDDALGELENSMDDLWDATDRADDLEFPPVEIDTGEDAERPSESDADYRRFCTDIGARAAELELRTRLAVRSWYIDLAESDQPMREISEAEIADVHRQVDEDFTHDLEDYSSQHPDVTCAV